MATAAENNLGAAGMVEMPGMLSSAIGGDDLMLDPSIYVGVGTLDLTPDQIAILIQDPNDSEIDILVTGEVYMSHVHVRARLIQAFKPAGWAMRPLSRERTEEDSDGKTVCFEQMWGMFVRGIFVAAAWGSNEWRRDNDRSNRTDALEACKSNALTRCAKDLGIAAQCWDKRWADAWRAGKCFRVWLEKGDRGGSNKPVWRRMDAPAFWNEKGIADDSPNKEKYNLPKQTQAGRQPPPQGAQAPTGTTNGGYRQPQAAASSQAPTQRQGNNPVPATAKPDFQPPGQSAPATGTIRVIELLQTADLFRSIDDAKQPDGKAHVYRCVTDKRTYAWFSYEKMENGQLGSDAFTTAKELEKSVVVIDYVTQSRGDGQGVNNKLRGVRALTLAEQAHVNQQTVANAKHGK
jgi:hypothetical protein